MKNILVPTDFSECARNAAKIAIELAEQVNAEVHFLHIMNTPVDWVKLSKAQEKNYPETLQAIGSAKAQLTELEKAAQQSGLQAKSFLAFNKPQHEIIDHLRDHGHDFVVMGSHGSKGVKELFIGSNAQKAVRHSPVPVLIVKNLPANDNWKNIVFASDFGREADDVYSSIEEFAHITGAKTHLVYINIPNNFEETPQSRKRINAFVKRTKAPDDAVHIWNALNEERGILQFTEEIKADVIALATHGKTGLIGRMSPSIAESLVNHANVPVLSVRVPGV